jgi:hypothetical protein
VANVDVTAYRGEVFVSYGTRDTTVEELRGSRARQVPGRLRGFHQVLYGAVLTP